MHYFTHHGDFAKGSYFDKVRRAHVGHHFIDPNKSKDSPLLPQYLALISFWNFLSILGRPIRNKKKNCKSRLASILKKITTPPQEIQKKNRLQEQAFSKKNTNTRKNMHPRKFQIRKQADINIFNPQFLLE